MDQGEGRGGGQRRGKSRRKRPKGGEKAERVAQISKRIIALERREKKNNLQKIISQKEQKHKQKHKQKQKDN